VQVIATAGHVDHGKSALVRALTGMEPVRRAEERRRGLTIDLGFAWMSLPGGERLAFVDVPGHERLVRTSACDWTVATFGSWPTTSEPSQPETPGRVRRVENPANPADPKQAAILRIPLPRCLRT